MAECERHCGVCLENLCMHKVPIFSTLEHSHLMTIAEQIRHKDYRKGESIFKEGDHVDSMIIINEGSAKALKYTGDGREQILYIFSEGDFFGEQYLLTDQTAAYSVEALEPVKLCMLSKNELRSILKEYSEIAVNIIEELGARMQRLENSMQSMGIRNVDTRVATLLLDFAQKYGQSDEEGILIRLPLSREGMANYMGIARETVSRKLGQFESDGIIRSISNKSLRILNYTALETLASGTE